MIEIDFFCMVSYKVDKVRKVYKLIMINVLMINDQLPYHISYKEGDIQPQSSTIITIGIICFVEGVINKKCSNRTRYNPS